MHYGPGVNPTSNSPNGNNRQCKKCGIMCSSESELQEHISNVHGSSPYGSSSGYSGSPFIKEEGNVISTANANAGDILDLDSQKMVYPHELDADQHDTPNLHENPLHSMHTMQQRALPSWEQPSVMPPGGVPVYYASKQTNLSAFGVDVKQEFMKPEFPDSQHFTANTVSGVTDISQQTPSTIMSISSSPDEFPSTTTADVVQDQQQTQQQQQQSQPFRNPPATGSTISNTGTTSKAAAWKSNEARRPKTYNCTACNKWFTSSGHLKRHYNTTLHKNAVKSSNQPDPATLPISVHHHPARDPNSKHNRRNSQQQQQQQASKSQQQAPPATVPVTETPVSPTAYTNVSGQNTTHISNYSASPSPTQNSYQHQYIPQASNMSSILSGVATPTTSNGSSNNLNGHPNALAGLSVPITPTLGTTMPSSQMRGLLSTTVINWSKNETSKEEDATLEKAMDVVNMEPDQHQVQMQPPLELMEPQQQHQELLSVQKRDQLVQEQLVQYHTNNLANNNTNLTSAHSICRQAFLEEHQQQMADNTYLPITTIPSPPQQQQQQQLVHLQAQQLEHNIMEQQQQQQLQPQQQDIMHLDISISNMPQQQPYITHIATTAAHPMGMDMQQRRESAVALEEVQARQDSVKLEAQLEEQQDKVLEEHLQQVLPSMPHCHTLLNNTNLEALDNMLTPTHINTQQQQHMQRIINMHTTHTMLPLTTITAQQLQPQPTHTPQQQPPTTNTTTIPCFQQLQQQAVGSLSGSQALVPLEPTMTYHTIIGDSTRNSHVNNHDSLQQQILSADDFLNLDANANAFDNYGAQNGIQQQFIGNNDIQILQLVSGPQSSYLAFAPEQPNQDDANDHMFAYNSFMPIEDLPSNQVTSAEGGNVSDNTGSISSQINQNNDTDNKSNIFGNSENSKSDEHQAFDAMTLDTKKRNLKRKKRTIQKNKIMKNYEDGDVDPDIEHEQDGKREVGRSAGILLSTGRIKCSKCPKTFAKPCYLTQHMKIHAGKCPFRCIKCGKRYIVEEIFKAHVARHGSVDKPHKCTTCEKQFHHKTDLRRHIEVIHKNEKKHVCPLCPKGFCRNDHLLKHIETHYRTRTTKDKIVKDPKDTKPKRNRRKPSTSTSSSTTTTTSAQNVNLVDNNNLNQNVQMQPQQDTNIVKIENIDNSDNSPTIVSMDEDDYEQINNDSEEASDETLSQLKAFIPKSLSFF